MRIHEIALLVPDLERAADFYNGTLGLPIATRTDTELQLTVGLSTLTFVRDTTPAHYHFAFTIPQNQFAAGKAWLAERVTIATEPDGNDELFFENWNAHSCYFYDPFGNIGELIAHQTAANASDAPFTSQSLLAISEIGIPVEDVLDFVVTAGKTWGLRPYLNESSEVFTAIGDQDGLLITVKRGRNWLPDLTTPALDLPARVVLNDANGAAQTVTRWG